MSVSTGSIVCMFCCRVVFVDTRKNYGAAGVREREKERERTMERPATGLVLPLIALSLGPEEEPAEDDTGVHATTIAKGKKLTKEEAMRLEEAGRRRVEPIVSKNTTRAAKRAAFNERQENEFKQLLAKEALTPGAREERLRRIKWYYDSCVRLHDFLRDRDVAKERGCDFSIGGENECSSEGWMQAIDLRTSTKLKVLDDVKFQLAAGDPWTWKKLEGTFEEKLAQFQAEPRALELLNPDAKVCTGVNFLFYKPRSYFYERRSAAVIQEKGDFTDEIIGQVTHYAFSDEEDAFVLATLVETAEAAKAQNLPWPGSAFMYLTLVCSEVSTKVKGGVGAIHQLARLAHGLGVNFILLSALPNVVSYYAKLFQSEFIKRGRDNRMELVTVPSDLSVTTRWAPLFDASGSYLVPMSAAERKGKESKSKVAEAKMLRNLPVAPPLVQSPRVPPPPPPPPPEEPRSYCVIS